MKKPMVRIADVEREMTAAEFDQYKIDQAAFVAEQAAIEAKVAARQAILDRLGLTAEEAALILG
jgi:hypothetical protein